MCRQTDCKNCTKKTWAGCGKHIDSALRDVPEADRCSGWKTGKCLDPPNPNAPKSDCNVA